MHHGLVDSFEEGFTEVFTIQPPVPRSTCPCSRWVSAWITRCLRILSSLRMNLVLAGAD